MKQIIFLVCIALFGNYSFAQYSGAAEAIDSVNAALDANRLDKAFHIYAEAMKQMPESDSLYISRAALNYMIGSFRDAATDYEKAYLLTTNDTLKLSSLISVASAKAGYRDFKGAESTLLVALKMDPEHIETLSNLAVVYDELGKRKEAIAYLEKIIEIDDTFFPAYVNLGFISQKMDNQKKAIEFFDKAVILNPDEPFTYNNRGFSYYELGDYDKALEDINHSLSIMKTNSYAYRNRAFVYMKLGQKEKACNDLYTALEYGYTDQYGDEVITLYKQYCNE